MSKDPTKPEPGRIILAVISALYIVYMWTEKDIASIYATMPPEQVLPMILTTVAVSTLKLAALAAGIPLVKWLYGKIKK